MPYTISIEGEELRRFEEDWPDDVPYRPVESIEFMYDSAGGFYCARAQQVRPVRDGGDLGACAACSGYVARVERWRNCRTVDLRNVKLKL